MLGYLREMFLFDDWANREALRSLQEMEHPPERARKVMAHIVAAELLWMARLQQAGQKTAVWPEFGLQDCERQIAELRQTWDQYLAKLADADLDAEIAYTNSKGERLPQRGARHPDARPDARRVSPRPDCGGGARPRRRAGVHRLHRGGEERQADGGEFRVLILWAPAPSSAASENYSVVILSITTLTLSRAIGAHAGVDAEERAISL